MTCAEYMWNIDLPCGRKLCNEFALLQVVDRIPLMLRGDAFPLEPKACHSLPRLLAPTIFDIIAACLGERPTTFSDHFRPTWASMRDGETSTLTRKRFGGYQERALDWKFSGLFANSALVGFGTGIVRSERANLFPERIVRSTWLSKRITMFARMCRSTTTIIKNSNTILQGF